MKLHLTIFMVLCVVFLLTGASPQEKCRHCKNQGLIACKNSACAQKGCNTKLPHRCDRVFRAKCCQGFRHTVCQKCRSEKALRQHREFKKVRKTWLKNMKDVDLKVGIRFAHIETEHFLIHNAHTNWRFEHHGKKDRTEGAHIWAERVESAAADVKELLGEFRAGKKHRVFLVWTEADNMSAFRGYGHTLEYAKSSFRFGRVGIRCQIFGFPNSEQRYTDRGMHSFVYHHACYSMIGYLAKNGQIPQWLAIGATHLLDLEKFDRAGDVNEFLLSSDQHSKNPWFIKARWHKLVAKRLRKQKISLSAIMAKKHHESLEENAICWSLVNFLCRKKYKAKIKDLIKALSEGMPMEKAMISAFGMNLEKLESEWRRYAMVGRK